MELLIIQGAVDGRRPPGRQHSQHVALPGCLWLECRHWAASATAAIVAAGEQFGRRHAYSCGLVGRCTGERVRQRGMSVRKALVAGEASAVLQACGDAIVTGMAQTNANDLVLIVVR